MSELVRIEQEGAIATVTLNQPEKRNPISGLDMIDALEAAMRTLDGDLGVRVVILTGAGSAFSTGGDLKAMIAPKSSLRDPLPAQTRRNYKVGIQRLPLLFESLEVPVIAAINGPAIGAGCDLACMCDVRIAGESAKFAESFVKLGIVPGDGGAWLLPRIIGFAKASELALTGDMLDAQQALACGLVSRVVPDDQLMDEARIVANKIAANPPHAVRMTKKLLREGYRATLANILELSAAMQALGHATADHDEAVSAFLEKRAPQFSGS
ncbi:crotonase/enoyl-CoA hydratase family protein [Sphingomonas sp. M1-B02]|uniref:crotonase/enoyl-CoA hydratase family protein n=1 Tax=Sphingomonas sp. M1-B02 TaxID=3114300 RepID=UPI00223F6CAF|nr:crotonase/enoyl-CoA hydratase family protein [Sphingomonas sp. S6-11]UZK67305.1 crotonase/enoyl-CoA hydratase family protein [Sphingomonas sp. S6-11]